MSAARPQDIEAWIYNFEPAAGRRFTRRSENKAAERNNQGFLVTITSTKLEEAI